MAKQKANGGTAPAGTRLGEPDGIERPALTVKLDLAGRIFSFIRQKWLVEKATELGVTRIVPLTTTRGVAQPGDQALERLRRSVVEASKP